MKEFSMNEQEIKQAAIEFKKALIEWKSREKIVRVASIHRPEWDDDDIQKSIQFNTRLVRPVLEAFEPPRLYQRLFIQVKQHCLTD